MFTNLEWIIILVILVIGMIFTKDGDEDVINYNCYDKSVYKCGSCNKKCKWKNIIDQYEKLD